MGRGSTDAWRKHGGEGVSGLAGLSLWCTKEHWPYPVGQLLNQSFW